MSLASSLALISLPGIYCSRCGHYGLLPRSARNGTLAGSRGGTPRNYFTENIFRKGLLNFHEGSLGPVKPPRTRFPSCRTGRNKQGKSSESSSSDEVHSFVEKVLLAGPLPALCVFDLDHTLFRCYLDCDSHGPPFKMVSVDTVEDAQGRIISLYPESRACTEALKTVGVKMCIASRSPVAGWYKQVLDAHNMLPDFDPVYIHGGGDIGYPGTKLGHFLNITKVTGIEFEDMIFMDDEYGNIEDMERHGVVSQYVPHNGATLEALARLIDKWRTMRTR